MRAGALAHEQVGERERQPVVAEHVRREHQFEAFRRLEPLAVAQAGVVHQHVQPCRTVQPVRAREVLNRLLAGGIERQDHHVVRAALGPILAATRSPLSTSRQPSTSDAPARPN